MLALTTLIFNPLVRDAAAGGAGEQVGVGLDPCRFHFGCGAVDGSARGVRDGVGAPAPRRAEAPAPTADRQIETRALELGALDDDNKLTKVGEALAKLRSHGEAAAVWLQPTRFGNGTWPPCELQTKVTINFCLRLFAVERSAHQAPPLCNPNTTLIGWLPWCDW